MKYQTYLKRSIDFAFASIFIIILLPILIALATILMVLNFDNPFFCQVRPGKNAKIFKIIKFKTMNDVFDKNGKLLADEKRISRIGKIVRSTSMDELPQLINVIMGDMSLVGPRPLLVHYLPLYSKEQFRRHEVRPGITGWTQVNGRNTLSWEKKFELDVWYVDHLSFTLDMKILWLTIIKVFKREGINSAIAATMPPFKGTN